MRGGLNDPSLFLHSNDRPAVPPAPGVSRTRSTGWATACTASVSSGRTGTIYNISVRSRRCQGTCANMQRTGNIPGMENFRRRHRQQCALRGVRGMTPGPRPKKAIVEAEKRLPHGGDRCWMSPGSGDFSATSSFSPGPAGCLHPGRESRTHACEPREIERSFREAIREPPGGTAACNNLPGDPSPRALGGMAVFPYQG